MVLSTWKGAPGTRRPDYGATAKRIAYGTREKGEPLESRATDEMLGREVSIVATWGYLQQVCASCRFWGGRREIDFTGSFYEPLEDEGKCLNPHGGFRGVLMSQGASCSDWECFRPDRD